MREQPAGAVEPSATLAADERIRRKIEAGVPVVHLAFGEAGLPVHPAIAEALALGSPDNAYGQVAGSHAAREAAAGYFERRGLPTEAGQIVFAPGSKALLFGLISVLPGDVVLPQPSWVSYAAQAALAGKRVWRAPIGAPAGGVPDPAALEHAVADARANGGDPGVLVLTLPDNPTGTVAPAALVREICELAEAHDLAIVSDEIYRDLTHRPEAFCSPAELAPERTYVTSGLSKSMALGGWRIGFVRLPKASPALRPLTGLASEVWSSLAAPMQHAAAFVLDEPAELREHVAASRRLHRTTTRAVHRMLVEAGVECRAPDAAFYLYPDFEPLRPQLAALGAHTGTELAELLLERFEIAVLAGEAFGDDPSALRFRLATSLLYGRNDVERWEALRSDDPTALPWIHPALERIQGALRDIAALSPSVTAAATPSRAASSGR